MGWLWSSSSLGNLLCATTGDLLSSRRLFNQWMDSLSQLRFRCFCIEFWFNHSLSISNGNKSREKYQRANRHIQLCFQSMYEPTHKRWHVWTSETRVECWWRAAKIAKSIYGRSAATNALWWVVEGGRRRIGGSVLCYNSADNNRKTAVRTISMWLVLLSTLTCAIDKYSRGIGKKSWIT